MPLAAGVTGIAWPLDPAEPDYPAEPDNPHVGRHASPLGERAGAVVDLRVVCDGDALFA
jgi:hypothetical protein